MRTINSNTEHLDLVLERANKDTQLRSMYRKANQARRSEYLSAEHLYRLKVGDTVTDESGRMTGQEARLKNKRLEDLFWKALDKNPRARLSRWVWQKP